MAPSWSRFLIKPQILDSAFVAVTTIFNPSNHASVVKYIIQCREMTDLLRIVLVICGSRQLDGGIEPACNSIGGNEGKPSIYVAESHLNLL